MNTRIFKFLTVLTAVSALAASPVFADNDTYESGSASTVTNNNTNVAGDSTGSNTISTGDLNVGDDSTGTNTFDTGNLVVKDDSTGPNTIGGGLNVEGDVLGDTTVEGGMIVQGGIDTAHIAQADFTTNNYNAPVLNGEVSSFVMNQTGDLESGGGGVSQSNRQSVDFRDFSAGGKANSENNPDIDASLIDNSSNAMVVREPPIDTDPMPALGFAPASHYTGDEPVSLYSNNGSGGNLNISQSNVVGKNETIGALYSNIGNISNAIAGNSISGNYNTVHGPLNLPTDSPERAD